MTPAISATLTKVSPPPAGDEPVEIPFAFNPQWLSVSHSYTTAGATGSTRDEQIKTLGFLEIRMDKVHLVGPNTKSYGDALIDWSCPAPSSLAAPGAQSNVQPVALRFEWGVGFSYAVSLRSVTITYTRFAGDTGKPIRADVNLELYSSLAPRLKGTNPTSGGPPGRSAHVLDASECLASLATASYGQPGAWRRIARANGIDDPLRVRAGTLLYLPEPGGGQ